MRKPLITITLKGKLVTFARQIPMANEEVKVLTVGPSGSQFLEELVRGTTDDQGRFSIRTRQARSNQYTLQFGPSAPLGGEMTIHTKKTKVDLGIIMAGFENFICKVRYISDSGRCAKVTLFSTTANLRAGIDTNLLAPLSVRIGAFNAGQRAFGTGVQLLQCQTGFILGSRSFSAPIGSSDTLRLTCRY